MLRFVIIQVIYCLWKFTTQGMWHSDRQKLGSHFGYFWITGFCTKILIDQRSYQPKMSLIDFDSMILATAVLHPTFHMNQAQVPAKMSMKTESATGSKGGDHSGFTRAAVKKRFNWIITFCPSSNIGIPSKQREDCRKKHWYLWLMHSQLFSPCPTWFLWLGRQTLMAHLYIKADDWLLELGVPSISKKTPPSSPKQISNKLVLLGTKAISDLAKQQVANALHC